MVQIVLVAVVRDFFAIYSQVAMPQTQNNRPLKRYSTLCLTLAALLCAQIASAQSSALAEEGKKTHSTKVARTTVELVIKAPREVVWKKLTDFDNYPQLFPRVKSCQVLKRESDSVYLESVLKPQLFVKQATQHTINDIGGSPNVLRWRMLDGNFKSAVGEWTLSPIDGGKHCKARYALEIDPGPVIPRTMASMVIAMVQKEIMADVKRAIEVDYARTCEARGLESALLTTGTNETVARLANLNAHNDEKKN